MAALADSIDDLTAEWFTGALQAGGVLAPGSSVATVDAELFGTGQFGLVARAELVYEGDAGAAPASVIVKLPSPDAGSRQLGIAIGAYEGEVRFYQELAPRTDVDVPRAIWTDFEPGTGRVTLVLEDRSRDWRVGDAIAGGTVAQAEAAIDQIARVQADLWDDPSLRELSWLADPGRTQILFDGVPGALPAFRERFAGRLEPRQLEIVERLAPRGADFPRIAWTGPMVVCHGDFRLDNVLFREDGGRTVATVLDWQSLRLGPPGIDVGTWLASCLTPDDRRTHLEPLLHRWHDRLVEGGVDGFAYDDCVASARLGALYVFLLSVSISVTIQQSERGDAMFAAMVAQAADFVADLGAETVL